MKKLGKAASLFFMVGIMALFSACDNQGTVSVVAETDEPMYRRAKDLLDRGKRPEALENFLKLILKRDDDAPESHLEVARIYMYHIKDPISAIYHLKRYQALQKRNPMGANASQKIELVDGLIETAMKDFAASFDADAFQAPLERLNLMDTISQLRAENEDLKVDLEKARRQIVEAGRTPAASRNTNGYANDGRASQPNVSYQTQPRVAEPRRTPPAQSLVTSNVTGGTGTRYYTIKTGDTLYRISTEVYGDGSRWQDILRANQDVIPDSSRLQIGERLVIP